MELVDRIQVIMKVNQLTAAQLAEEIGVQRSNVSHVLSGRNKPSFEFLNKLLMRYPKVNAHWLITGKSKETESNDSPKENPQQRETEAKVVEEKAIHTDEGVERIVIFYRDGTFKSYDSGGRDS